MRILHVIPSVNLTGGGPIEWVRQVCPVLADQGHDCEVASLDAPDAPCVAAFPVRTHALGPSRPVYRYSSRLVPWLRRNVHNYDCVISHGLWQYSSLGVSRGLRGSGVPYFVYPHGMLDPWFKRAYPLKHLKKLPYWLWAEYRVLRDAAAVLYTCEEERRLARQSFRPYRANEAVTALGTEAVQADVEAYQGRLRASYPELAGKRLFLFLSRIHPKKGCDILIEAFARVAPEDADLHLLMAGPDSSGWVDSLQRRAERLGIGSRVTWTGMVSGEEKLAALCAAEVFILPSHQETFPLSVTEATSCGVPVLITDRVNIWQELQKSGAGLIGRDDVEGVADMIRRWIGLAPAEKEAMREAARACFAQHFEINRSARELAAVLRSCGVGPRPAGAPSSPLEGPHTP